MIKKAKLEKPIYIILYILLLALICFFCFYKLDTKYVDPFDEARHGINAYEMLKEGKLVESTYLYETDYYNLKPPLSMWLIMIGYGILGKSVFAMRFMSGLCYVILAIVTALFVKKHFGKLESIFVLGFMACNTTPFIAHMIRAGDADSLYVLIFSLAMYAMLEISINSKMLPVCGFLISMAFLTKSYHAAMIGVILVIYLVTTGLFKKIKMKDYISFLCTLLSPIIIWALARISVDGLTFFKQMIGVDVISRASGEMESSKLPMNFYVDYFFGSYSGKITVYLCILILCILTAFVFCNLFTKENYKKIIGYVLWFAIPLIGFSLVGNKLLWYVYPITIPLLICGGVGVGRLIKEQKLGVLLRLATLFFAIGVIGHYTKDIYVQIQNQKGNDFQDVVAYIGNLPEYKEWNAYVAFLEGDDNPICNSVWSQQDVLVAELNGDFVCVNGSLNDFLMDKKPSVCFAQKRIILLEEEEKTSIYEQYAIYETEEYIVLANN